jgi:hypothetical protein
MPIRQSLRAVGGPQPRHPFSLFLRFNMILDLAKIGLDKGVLVNYNSYTISVN